MKEEIVIILISKDEYQKIRERFPDVHIRRTVKQKSKRGRYYCTERRDVMNYLMNNIRGASVCYSNTEENISDRLV